MIVKKLCPNFKPALYSISPDAPFSCEVLEKLVLESYSIKESKSSLFLVVDPDALKYTDSIEIMRQNIMKSKKVEKI
uniref:CSON014820 protein n=1 Tax=Culicoides sonorensis TaxID=179676 RepID=A0A336MC09_CULSO